MNEDITNEEDAKLADEFAKAALTGILASGEFQMAGLASQEFVLITNRAYQLAQVMVRKSKELRK
jgi:hypothetical protein